MNEYKSKVEQELNNICEDILDLLKNSLIPGSPEGEARVFYLKMEADYCRSEESCR